MIVLTKLSNFLRDRIIINEIEAWDLGIFAHSWRVSPWFGWRLVTVMSSHDVNGIGSEGIGPPKLYFFVGNLEKQVTSFYDGASK